MAARDVEFEIISQCVDVARGVACLAKDQRAANVFNFAATVVRSRFPDESRRLTLASEHHFYQKPNDKVSLAVVVKNGWISCLPRFRDMLTSRLL